jgi:P27 family predicted phage terminase small subunit
MPAGRKPKPSALKMLEGNPGKRRLNESEPQPGGIPTCPKSLDKAARAEWKRVSKELVAIGLLTSVDRAVLASYCQAWSRWTQATEAFNTKPVLVVATKTGYPIQNPLIGIINTAADQMRKLAAELGLSPSARSRLSVEPPAKPGDMFSAFMSSLGADDVEEMTPSNADTVCTTSD